MKIQTLPKKIITSSLAAAAIAALGITSATATDYTWVGPTGGPWNNASNWTPAGGPPGITDNVIWNSGASNNAMVNVSNFTFNDLTLSAGSQFTQIGVGNAGAPISFNVNGNMTHTGTGSSLLFRGSTGSEGTNILSVNIGGNLSTSGGQALNFGQHRTDTRYNYALNGLSVSGTTTINNGTTVSIYTNGATASFGEVNLGTTGNNYLILNNGTPTSNHGSNYPGTRTVQVAGLSGGASGSSRVAASDTSNFGAVTTLQLTGSGNYDFGGRILNRTDNSVSGSILTVEKTGSGTQTLSGTLNSGYSGNTTVSAGTLIVNTELSRTPLINVASGAIFGGNGSASAVGATLQLNTGSKFIFNSLSLVGDPNFETFSIANLTFSGTGQFSLSNLVNADGSAVDWSSVNNGTYTLVDATITASDFSTYVDSSIFNIGGSRTAQFQNGSLQLVVIPEPSTWLLLALGGTALVVLRRRTTRA